MAEEMGESKEMEQVVGEAGQSAQAGELSLDEQLRVLTEEGKPADAGAQVSEQVKGVDGRVAELEKRFTGVLNELREKRAENTALKGEVSSYQQVLQGGGQPGGQAGRPVEPALEFAPEEVASYGGVDQRIRQLVGPYVQDLYTVNQRLAQEVVNLRAQGKHSDWHEVVEKHAKPRLRAMPNGEELEKSMTPDQLYAFGQVAREGKAGAAEGAGETAEGRILNLGRVTTQAGKLAELGQAARVVAGSGATTGGFELTDEGIKRLASIDDDKLPPSIKANLGMNLKE